MSKSLKNRASKQTYVSIKQVSIEEFSPFSQKLDPSNRWVVLAKQIPWDQLASVYQSSLKNKNTGALGINPRVVIGAVIIKHLCDLSDRETIQSIQENVYMQYFIGYQSFSYEEPFDASLFVGIRKRLTDKKLNKINELILNLRKQTTEPDAPKVTHQGNMIVDATACPQDIAYPTDLDLLNEAREKSEMLIAVLYDRSLHDKMPRTDKKQGRKDYLNVSQKKNKTKKAITKAVRQQLRYVGRNIKSIHTLLDKYDDIPLEKQDYKYLLVIQTCYDQQKLMFDTKTHSVADRIVSIHQPHVRPIVRGKANAKVEFGAKINVSLMNGYSFLDKLSWDAFNEGSHLISSVEKYKERFGFLPNKVLVDKIYCTRDNRNILKEMGIQLAAKPLGRPKAGVESSVSPGERNPIEGKFGQAKTAYGLGRIKARLANTSESWIASILMVLNLVKLIGEAPLWLMVCIVEKIRFSCRYKFHAAYSLTYSADPTWTKDTAGNDWVAINIQGEGGKMYFPSKDHPSDEPNEGVDLKITVPTDLKVAGPGLLKEVITKKNKSTYYWKTNYTISNYCILFNIGKYKVIKDAYTTIEGNNVPIEYYVLEVDTAQAKKVIELKKRDTRILEKYFGEYPWVKEKIGIAEVPNSGMEHQTMITFDNKFKYRTINGQEYSDNLFHEYAHEWWANKVTNKDWAHMWIQEGIATYAEALAMLEIGGETAYNAIIDGHRRGVKNKKAMVLGDEITEEEVYSGGDIYGKGSFFMHSLRNLIGDEIFFPTLKKLATEPKYTYDNFVTSDDVEKLFSTASKINLKPFFDFYLRTTDVLDIDVKEIGIKKYQIKVSVQPTPYFVGKNLAFTLPKKADERLATNYQGVRII